MTEDQKMEKGKELSKKFLELAQVELKDVQEVGDVFDLCCNSLLNALQVLLVDHALMLPPDKQVAYIEKSVEKIRKTFLMDLEHMNSPAPAGSKLH